VLTLEPDATSAQLLREPTRAHPGGGVVVPSYAAVDSGERVDVEMQAPRGGILRASGVVRAVIPRAGSRAPWLHIIFVRTHAHRVNRMLELASSFDGRPQPHPIAAPASNATVLRVRGDASLLDSLKLPGGSLVGGAAELAWRGPRRIGEEVKVEISLGAMADPIELVGRINKVSNRAEGGPAPAQIVFSEPHGHRLRYVVDVLRGERSPTTRAYPRYEVDLKGRWWMGARAQDQVFHDLSRGGAFIETKGDLTVAVGTPVPVEIYDRHGVPLRLQSEVVWSSRNPERPGFGTRFRIASKELADRLSDLLEREGQGELAWV
jgi:hypothetical protein